jgi:chemotaxis family two-component system sensor kinase Cph1
MMFAARAQLSESERRRLAECVLEPIRTPGAIQPHGVLVAFRVDSTAIRQVSSNCAQVFALPPEGILGQTMTELLGADTIRLVRDVLDSRTPAINPILVSLDGRDHNLIVHQLDDLVLAEFEPAAAPHLRHSSATMFGALHRLARATSAEQLWAMVAREVRLLTGFDHTMVYHFHADGHGEIVAEERLDGTDRYLGLHFPASDIPAQARDLYVTKLSRMIADTSGAVAKLLSIDDTGDLDLSQAELRSVSPYHLEFMRNMGQASTFSLSLVNNGALIGMITSAHGTTRVLDFDLRRGLEILATQVALQLASFVTVNALIDRMRVRSIRGTLVEQLAVSDDISSLLEGESTLLDLIAADGAMIALGGHAVTLGAVPPMESVGEVNRLGAEMLSPIVATDALALDYPLFSRMLPDVAGLLLVPVGVDGDFVAWFRGEQIREVRWLGDQSSANRPAPLSPRSSFSAWSQTVTDTSHPWGDLPGEARELSRDLTGVMLRRAESQLAMVALHDALTGLPNRRLLSDRLDHSLAKYARGEELALLFVDIDHFKQVNDTYGHDQGDVLLQEVANRLVGATRAEDTVARIGGDEFIVLCDNTTAEEADVVAGRILDALRRPIRLGDEDISVTVSLGIAAANLTFGASELLREADHAMYRAKTGGRDRAAR